MDWVGLYPEIKMAYNEAISAIADRREIKALKREVDASVVMPMMPHYDRDWKEMTEWRSRLKVDENKASGPQIVEIPVMAESKTVKVPVKEAKE